MPIPNPRETQKQHHFGRTPFEPLRPVPLGDFPTGVVISEQASRDDPPNWHEVKREVSDKETTEIEMLTHVKRSPTDWQPMTFVFDGIQVQQIAGRQPGRETIVFFNSSGNVTIAKTPAGIKTNENFILNAGSSVSIDVEGEFFGFAVNGTTLSVVYTYFDLDAIAIAKIKLAKSMLRHDFPRHDMPAGSAR